VLINNAGIAVEKLAVIRPRRLDRRHANLRRVFRRDRNGAAMIARKQEGNIVNIASVLGLSVMKFLSPYTISKAGIIQPQGDGAELPATASASIALAPGYIDTR